MRKVMVILIVGLLLLGLLASAAEYVIVQSHDVHGMYLPKKGKGGMEAWAAEIIKLRKEYPNRVIVVDSGDVNTGTLISDVAYKGVLGGAMIEFMNELGYDVWTPGNHEFDKGQENCIGYAMLADFPTVCANVVYTSTGEPFFPPYTIINVNGLRIGIIGVMEEIFKIEIIKENTEGLDVLPIAPVVNMYAKFLKPRTDLIFVLVQGGKEDTKAAAQPNVDLILPAEAPAKGGEVGPSGNVAKINGIYVAAGPSGKDGGIGKITIDVENKKIVSVKEEDLWLSAEKAKPPAKIKTMVEEYQKMIDEEFGTVIGQLKTPWVRAQPESNIGDWQTDVMRAKTGTDFAFQNSGGIRKDLPAGPITKKDIMEISPFHNTLATFTVSGAELKHILEWNFERGWDYLQMSGITCTVNMNKKYGERVTDIYVNGKPLDLNKIYTGTFNDYGIGHDKDKYFDLEAHNKVNTHIPLAQTEIEAVIAQKVIDIKVQNRIKVIGKKEK
ncbi:MAG: bifunctional metallophosphatase/5'-nucleotidase [Thermotogae bacterium]|nr:bifunctional metallophosphatase/5'-nucleotidase [Thermotogota bacterium]